MTSPALTVNGSVDNDSSAVVSNNVDADDNRWEQVRSRNRTVFNSAVSDLLYSSPVDGLVLLNFSL